MSRLWAAVGGLLGLLGCTPLPASPVARPAAPGSPTGAAAPARRTDARAVQLPPAGGVRRVALPSKPPASVSSRRELGPSCPAEMALVERVQGPYCIDRWEAAIVVVEPDGSESAWPGNRTVHAVEAQMKAISVAGRKPQGYISGEQAALACGRAGKRLCEIDEWVRACRGPDLTLYPYGNQRQPNVCNDRFRKLDYHPVVRLFRQHAPPGTDPVQMWHPRWMNDPRLHEFDHTVSPTGAFSGCTNEYGVYDMVGNLHEWVADEEGTFFGGFFMDTFQNGEGCEYRTVAHPFDYHDYSTGFRCCTDPPGPTDRAR